MLLLLFLVMVSVGWIHARLSGPRTPQRSAELMLVYPLVGYYGLLMGAIGVSMIVDPDGFAKGHGWRVDLDNPFHLFAGVEYVAMAVVALLSIWLRGTYLIAPALCWSLFFLGATWVHLHDEAARGHELDAHDMVHIFATHGAMSLLTLALLWLYLARLRRA